MARFKGRFRIESSSTGTWIHDKAENYRREHSRIRSCFLIHGTRPFHAPYIMSLFLVRTEHEAKP